MKMEQYSDDSEEQQEEIESDKPKMSFAKVVAGKEINQDLPISPDKENHQTENWVERKEDYSPQPTDDRKSAKFAVRESIDPEVLHMFTTAQPKQANPSK